MSILRGLSLFSGIGGLDLAFERAGGIVSAMCEIEPYCRRVLRKHWPDVLLFEDIRELKGSDVGAVDVIYGGFPCQPFSVAGNKRGKDDSRYMWPEFSRLVGETDSQQKCAIMNLAKYHYNASLDLQSGFESHLQFAYCITTMEDSYMNKRKPDPEKYCKVCGIRLYRKRYKSGRLEDMTVFLRRECCSLSCANTRQEVTEAGLRWRAEQLRGDKCEVCGTQTRLQAHHIDGDISNNAPANIQTLCISCHAKWHHHCRRIGRTTPGKADLEHWETP